MNEMITWEKRLADPLAVILAVLRSDWQIPGIMAALADPRLRDKNPAEVVRAAVKLASNPRVRTPAVLAMDGEHWRDYGEVRTLPQPVHQDPLLVPDADPDDPDAFAKALREGRLRRQSMKVTDGPAKARAALVEARTKELS
jgi:hypothetical protein